MCNFVKAWKALDMFAYSEPILIEEKITPLSTDSVQKNSNYHIKISYFKVLCSNLSATYADYRIH
ncbi:hypothetical protein FACS1894102_1280 [Spirochaetia bacterium]|nr:hypothetical protein FACS1894102_1280 [Spirochaetia bacterium]